MRSIAIRKHVEGDVPERFKEINSHDIFMAVVRAAPEGSDFEDQMRRQRIYVCIVEMRATEAQEMLLEDSDYEYFSGLVMRFKFGVFDPDLFTILTDVKQAAKVKVGKTTAKDK